LATPPRAEPNKTVEASPTKRRFRLMPATWSERISRSFDRFKPRSTAWRTTILVSMVSLFSLFMSLAFFWRTLYLPELRQHAHYLAIELRLLRESEEQIAIDPFALDLHEWILQSIGVDMVRDPALFPDQKQKLVAEFFTRELAAELQKSLNEPVAVYFEFKPVPQLWIHYPSLGDVWIREPLVFYAQYSSEILIAWLLGIPFITSIITLTLVRQLNRPLARLQQAARQYTRHAEAPHLNTARGPIEIRQVNAAFNQMIASLEQSARERTIMLAGISHDLRTPLTRMRLTAELLSDEYFREGLVYDVDDMDAILEQFISYMKDGSDEEPQPTDINSMCQELVVQFKPLQILYQPQTLPLVCVRGLSIKRVLGNLINNAKRYGAEPIWLGVSVIGSQLILTVRDSGEGVNPDDMQTLMQPFVRGESARTTQGSGLGLAIVKRIVDLHAGQVHVCNHPDKGFEVTICLPLQHPDSQDQTE
jgi:two-component system osmolarity sensor histidine kinase EnvZ